MATATSSKLNSAGVIGAIPMPRLSASSTGQSANSKANKSRKSAGATSKQRSEVNSSTADSGSSSQTEFKLGMPAEHSSPVLTCDTPDTVYPAVGKPQGITANFSSFSSLANAIIPGSSNRDEAAVRQRLKKYQHKLAENRAQQDALVNKQIASISSTSERAKREFEQRIHVLADKGQKLGRTIGQLESQLKTLAQSTQQGETPETVHPPISSKPSSCSLGGGKVTSLSSGNNKESFNATPSGAANAEQRKSDHSSQPGLHRAGSTSSSHSQSNPHTGSGHGGTGSADNKASTLPVSGSRPYVLKDVQESFKSTFKLRPSHATQESNDETSSRKFGSADNLQQINNPLNVSSSSGSCETAGSAAALPEISSILKPNQPSSTQYGNTGSALVQAVLPAMAFERARSIVTPSGHQQHHPPPYPGRPTGEKANAGTLPASFRFPPTGEEAIGAASVIQDEQTGNDETASQVTGGSGQAPIFSHAYHYPSGHPNYYPNPIALRELQEVRELRSEVDQLRHQFDRIEKQWNEKLDDLRVQLTDVKFSLASKPTHEDIQIVNQRCEEYSANSTEAVDLLRGDFNNTRMELSRQDQDLDNAIERLRRRVEELDFDAVATRLTLVEARISQVSNYVPGPEPSLRNVAAKLLNVLFALVALVLLLISTAARMAAPFIRTRIRFVVSAVLVVVLAVLYHYWLWRLFEEDSALMPYLDQIPIVNYYMTSLYRQ